MIILGIESATQQAGCAIGGAEGVFASFQSSRDRRHAEVLTPSIQFICEQANIEYKDIGLVAVDYGPGLYTGLRVGLATAKAIATALRVPMLGFSSLDLLAFPLRFSRRTLVSVIDAKRDEVFYARYKPVVGGVQRVSDYDVASPEKLINDLQADGEEYLLVGDGAIRYAHEFSSLTNIELASTEEAFPSATSIVMLAQEPAVHENYSQPNEIQPMYLRRTDAEINWDDRYSTENK